MSLKHKQSVLSIKDKQSIIVRLEKGEKGTNLSAEYNDIVFQMICKSVVSRLNVVFLI